MFSPRAHLIKTFLVFCIVIAVFSWLSTAINGGRDKPIEYKSEMGKVVQIHRMEHRNRSGQFSQFSWYAKVVLADGNEIILPMVFQPTPKVGDRVPLLRELDEEGSKYYALDRIRWQTGDY